MGCCNSIPAEYLTSDEPYYDITASAKIWNKESHGLFDYDIKNVFEVETIIKGNYFLYGTENKIEPFLPSVHPDDIFSK
jgi:hypothetical protein